MTRWVVFTDLDGTLLDRQTYDWSAATAGLETLYGLRVPIVFCSSKTRVEQAYYQQQLDLRYPFIVENGSAIIIPEGNFENACFPKYQMLDGVRIINLGVPSATIQEGLDRVQDQLGLNFRRFAQMTDEEVADLTGLDREQASRARQREFSETIDADFREDEWQNFRDELAKLGLVCLSGGHLHTVTSVSSSKGKAVKILTELYRERDSDVQTVGVGDSDNDKSMLASVDIPCQVKRPDGTWCDMGIPGIRRFGIGPTGWQEAVYAIVVR